MLAQTREICATLQITTATSPTPWTCTAKALHKTTTATSTSQAWDQQTGKFSRKARKLVFTLICTKRPSPPRPGRTTLEEKDLSKIVDIINKHYKLKLEVTTPA